METAKSSTLTFYVIDARNETKSTQEQTQYAWAEPEALEIAKGFDDEGNTEVNVCKYSNVEIKPFY